MPISGNSPETATWASELASPISPYRSSPLSPSLMISTLLRSPINSPYRHQSSFLRPTLHASPPAQPPSVLSPDSNERYYYLSPSRVRNVVLKTLLCSLLLALEVNSPLCLLFALFLAGVEEIVWKVIKIKWFVKLDLLYIDELKWRKINL